LNLKRLELKGFKSFADKTKIDFETGITGIVGPNGSGKSNISDAIRWVLGEQSAKSLRGSKMEDIIFNGTDKRKPLNYCEISMILDNSEGKFPLDYREIMVTRRVFRSGESEYYINKTTCRLRDIKEMFMDTGIGTDGYSIIGQGRIDEILSTKAEDRRKLFEEAAGIVKYKTRKINSERKLNKTEDNLLRVRDIIFELEKQIEPLERQSKKAEKYIILKEELSVKELGHYAYESEQIIKAKNELKEKLESTEDDRRNLFNDLKSNQIEYENKNDHLIIQDTKIEEFQENRILVKSDLEKKEGQINLFRERLATINRDLLRLKTEIDLSEIEKKSYLDKIDDLKLELNDQKNQNKVNNELLLELNQEINDKKHSLDAETDKIEKLKSEYVKKLNLITGLDAKASSYKVFEENINQRINDLENKKSIENTQKIMVCNEIDELEKLLVIDREKNSELTRKNESLVLENTNIKINLEKFQNETKRVEREYDSLKSKYKIFNDMKENHEGYFASVKKTLLYLDKNSNEKKGFEGVIADLIKVPKKYELAIEMSVGGALQNLVTKTESDAKRILKQIKQNKLGRVTFMPLDAIRGKRIELNLELKKQNGFLGIASELLKYSEEFQNIIEYIFGRILIFDNIDNALKFAKITKYKYKIVTLDGDVLNPGGSLTGGSNSNKQGSLLSRNRAIEEIKNELVIKRDLHNKLLDELTQTEKLLKTSNEQINDVNDEINKLVMIINNKENNISRKFEKTEEINDRIKQLEIELENIDEEKQNSENYISTIKEEKLNLENLSKDLEKEIQKKEIDINKLIEVSKELNMKLSELKIYMASYIEKQENLKLEFEHNQTAINKLDRENIQKDNLMKQLINEKKSTDDELENASIMIDKLKIELNDLEKSLENFKVEKESIKIKLDEIEKILDSKKEKIDNYQKKLHTWQIEIEKKDLKLASIEDKLFENYEMKLENLNIELDQNINYLVLEKEVKSLKNKIKTLGNVNLESIEEYKEVKERFEFLVAQEHDLIEAKDSLNQVIGEMEIQMRIQFKEKLEIIRANFADIFVKLFGGGKADIKILENEDILTSGIDIIAQPPGKKLQSILLLSGGEKALTAIALLFAILQMKPSPFCILDEIEAALDDANVSRFADYLNQYADQTQFIVITHRKGTMEAVDSLYGVTMEEKGVSTLVSVKMTDESINDFIK